MARYTIDECDRCKQQWTRDRSSLMSNLFKVEVKATVKTGLPRESEKELCEMCSNLFWREWTYFMAADAEDKKPSENRIHVLGAGDE